MPSADDLQNNLRRNVKVLMALRGIDTKRELARRLETNENHLSSQINGRRKWTLDDVAKLATVFGISPGLLIEDTEGLLALKQALDGSSTESSRYLTVPHPRSVDVLSLVTALFPEVNGLAVRGLPTTDSLQQGVPSTDYHDQPNVAA